MPKSRKPSTARKRAPRGYRIVPWQDGTYHTYAPGGDCINETATRAGGIESALDHQKQAQAHKDKPNTMPHLIPLAEVNMNTLSPEAIRLCREYREIVNQQESGDFTHGYTPTELDARRVRIHNKWLRELEKCGIDTSNRQGTRDLSVMIEKWMGQH